ncbi:hypothetical protein [Bradyrhizobium mercantei]|uniref:hypothetical protein n=1 Tax=Bradyrhizobium mercantei TaxID=1904807 RepID=UPI0011778EAF|nr:hypothetical protein [Bradyrhizobium mercantei]
MIRRRIRASDPQERRQQAQHLHIFANAHRLACHPYYRGHHFLRHVNHGNAVTGSHDRNTRTKDALQFRNSPSGQASPATACLEDLVRCDRFRNADASIGR